ncbi:glycerol-3-phosphate 1-O-acyltransferase PlsY [Streptococcus equinus]|uniref:glycerol-3-phosphate 1-O-acyltransferase PlsY n=1 Tax=Streptococcus equinus TaxID=1335 RepID=UPI003B59BBED
MKILVMIVIAYLLGSIPTGLWIGQYFYHVNLREHGSGNTGTTNTFRVLGAKAGIITFIIDMLKGTLAALLPVIFSTPEVSAVLIGLFAIIGHTFPIFANFKGGKAVATSAGVLLGFAPLFLLYLVVIFVITLYLFSMISLSSVVAAGVAVLSVLIFPAFGFLLPHYDLLFTLLIILIASIIIVRHKDNITRIQNHEENLVPWGLNLSHQEKTKKD